MEKILLNIDSRQRDLSLFPHSSYFKLEYSDDYNYYDNDEKKASKMKYINNNYVNFKNVDYISIVTFELPNNFYVFQNQRFNTFFDITCINTDGNPNPNIIEGTRTIYIKEGNYNNDELLNNLNQSLNAYKFNIGSVDSIGDFIVSNGLKFEYDSNLNKYWLINLESNYTFTINLSNNNYDYNSLGYMLGFRLDNIILSENNINSNYKLIGTAQADIEGEKYFFVKVNDYGNIYISPKMPNKVLAKIVMDGWKKTYIYNNASDLVYKTHKFRQPTDIKSLEIEILDYTGKRVNFDGVDFSMTFEFGMIYDEAIYQKQLNNLSFTSNIPLPNTKLMGQYMDNINNYMVGSPTIKTANEILAPVFEVQPEIVPVQEIINLEKKREKKEKAKKNKFGIEY